MAPEDDNNVLPQPGEMFVRNLVLGRPELTGWAGNFWKGEGSAAACPEPRSETAAHPPRRRRSLPRPRGAPGWDSPPERLPDRRAPLPLQPGEAAAPAAPAMGSGSSRRRGPAGRAGQSRDPPGTAPADGEGAAAPPGHGRRAPAAGGSAEPRAGGSGAEAAGGGGGAPLQQAVSARRPRTGPPTLPAVALGPPAQPSPARVSPPPWAALPQPAPPAAAAASSEHQQRYILLIFAASRAPGSLCVFSLLLSFRFLFAVLLAFSVSGARQTRSREGPSRFSVSRCYWKFLFLTCRNR